MGGGGGGGHHHPFRAASPGEGPIITGPESIYGTIPRRGAYEEPVYMPGSHVGPPEASYQPANYPSDHYESYYDTYRRKTMKKVGLRCVDLTTALETNPPPPPAFLYILF